MFRSQHLLSGHHLPFRFYWTTFFIKDDEEDYCAINYSERPIVKIKVSGTTFRTYMSTLTNYPNTLLGSSDREIHFNKSLNCYFFDRSDVAFEAILHFYQTGNLRVPEQMDVKAFERELDFFGIAIPRKLFNEEDEAKAQSPIRRSTQDWPLWQRKIYYVVAEPDDSLQSKVWAFVDTFFILCSIILFIAETEADIKRKIQDRDGIWYKTFFWVDTICIIFFCFDFSIRFIVWPSKLNYIKSILTWVDMAAIAPFFIELITEYIESTHDHSDEHDEGEEVEEFSPQNHLVVLKVLRLMRVIRLLKLAKHSKDLMTLINVLYASRSELSILVLYWAIGIITFGSIIFYADSADPQTGITSIMTGCWWACVTMSTVGYGDLVPTTTAGKLLGTLVVYLSIICLALPMTIIVSKFSSSYESLQSEKQEIRDYATETEDDKTCNTVT